VNTAGLFTALLRGWTVILSRKFDARVLRLVSAERRRDCSSPGDALATSDETISATIGQALTHYGPRPASRSGHSRPGWFSLYQRS
jgi:hypothetical protein